MEFFIYSIENVVTNKIYVGYTKLKPENRWKQHQARASKGTTNTPFYNALRKWSSENWSLKILEKCECPEIAKEREIYYIAKLDTYHVGYNATKGGDGNNGIVMSSESNKKRSEALKGKKKNYSGWLGKKHTNETLQKMRKPKKDKTNYNTDSFKNKMRKVQLENSKKRRSLTKEQYDEIFNLLAQGKTKKQISIIMSINYDIVKKWSCKAW
jgi:group I intron endonuclease